MKERKRINNQVEKQSEQHAHLYTLEQVWR